MLTTTFLSRLMKISRPAYLSCIMSIHQPRYSIFKQCDTLTLLSLGNVVYHGSAQSALSYFETVGMVTKVTVECAV